MRLAVIADVHSNLQALQTVLEAIRACAPDRVLCLGDLVGYNANPNECIALVREHVDVVVAGNHDRDVLFGDPLIGTSLVAKQAQEWTREQLTPEHAAWLESLPGKAVLEGVYIAVHGCYLNPEHINGYVTPTMLERNLRAIEGSDEWPKLAFCGHTHIPMLAYVHKGQVRRPFVDEPTAWPQQATAVLINPGSVGQPRDQDPRSSFAIVDTEACSVRVERVAYDVESAVRAFAGTGLPQALWERLPLGR